MKSFSPAVRYLWHSNHSLHVGICNGLLSTSESRLTPRRAEGVRCHRHQAGVYMANRDLLSMLSKTKLLYSVQAKGGLSSRCVMVLCLKKHFFLALQARTNRPSQNVGKTMAHKQGYREQQSQQQRTLFQAKSLSHTLCPKSIATHDSYAISPQLTTLSAYTARRVLGLPLLHRNRANWVH